MRSPQDTCLLCKSSPSTKRNSHILPRFLKRVIHYNNPKKHAILYKSDHSQIPVQDIPKEDYILCDECEKKLGTLETYIARELNKIEKFSTGFKYSTIIISGNRYKKLNGVRSDLFSLFVYSLVWRMHTSTHDLFQNFTLSNKVLHKIRILLNEHLEINEKDLKQKPPIFEKLPFSYLFIKPDRIRDASWMIYYNGAPYNHIWFVCALSYFIVLSDEEKAVPKSFFPALNFRNEAPKIKLVSRKEWQSIIEVMINEFNSNAD